MVTVVGATKIVHCISKTLGTLVHSAEETWWLHLQVLGKQRTNLLSSLKVSELMSTF